MSKISYKLRKNCTIVKQLKWRKQIINISPSIEVDDNRKK